MSRDRARSQRKPPRQQPTIEALEQRELLSRTIPLRLVPAGSRTIMSDRAVYRLNLDGPGFVKVQPMRGGTFDVKLFGTTEESALTVRRLRVGPHFAGSGLPIGSIDVKSGLLGAIEARDTAELLGPVTPIANTVRTIELRTIGPEATIDLREGLGSLQAGSIQLGPQGGVHVARGLPGPIVVANALELDGGSILVDQGPIGGVIANRLTIQNGGRLASGGAFGPIHVATDLRIDSNGSLGSGTTLGGITTGRDLVIVPSGRIDVGTDSIGPIHVGEDLVLDGGPIVIQGDLVGGLSVGRDAHFTQGGQLVVVRDIAGPLEIGNNLTLDAGNLIVGRDVTAAATVGNNLVLSQGGQLGIGRNLTGGLTIGGNVNSTGGGSIQVGGNLNGLHITGAFIGQGPPAGPFGPTDLFVGLDLLDLVVLGFVPNQGSITNAVIDVGKSLVGIDVRHGIFNSLITVGVLIDGGPTPAGGHIGPDATYAVFNSEVRAGVQLRNLVINGDVASDQVTNPNGKRTRIVAGEDRAGIISSAGNIDNFQITGRLIDSVIVASVAPSGGDGNLEPTHPPVLSVGNYDAPAGTLAGGAIGSVIAFPHFAPGSYDEFGRLIGYFYDPVLSPVVDDLILPGAINASYAPTPLSPNPPPAAGTAVPLPTTSSVLGGVIDTAPPGDAFDHAGFFAADTRGVFVGALP